MTHTLLRSFLFTTTAAFLVSACADDATPEATIDVALSGERHEAWRLTGPVDEAPALAAELEAALGADAMAEGDSTASITLDDRTVEVPLEGGAGQTELDTLADAHGFTVSEAPPPVPATGDGKFDVGGANRGRIARAEVMNVIASRYDSMAIWNQTNGNWLVRTQKTGGGLHDLQRQWGMDYDYPLTGDYDGDGLSDTMIWRPSTGQWFLWTASGNRPAPIYLGAAGDIPVPGDYDGDKTTDRAYFRRATGEWKIRLKSGTTRSIINGTSLSIPVPGDYDGDGKTDTAFFLNGRFTVKQSRDNVTVVRNVGVYGTPMPGDYDADGKTDPAVWDAGGNWIVLESSRNYAAGQRRQWGYGTSDLPAGGNFDLDSTMDFNVFRPSNGMYYSLGLTGRDTSRGLGSNSYTPAIPVPGPYQHLASETVTLP